MKRRLFLAAVILICCALLGIGSVAYFTASATATNVITSGSVKIQLNEWADVEANPPVPFGDVTGVMPGASVPKFVEVENIGSAPAYIRVKVEKRLALPAGTEGETDPGLITLDINTADWTEKDGFYYYNRPLAPGETTAYLFTRVGFDSSMGNLYQNSAATVEVRAYATQVAHNGSSALQAAGWPAE